MRVLLVCPFPTGSRLGNRVTAERWRALLTELGHRARVTTGLPTGSYDVMVALHAFKTAEAVQRSRECHPDRPIVVALTGTDLYRDIRVEPAARRSLDLANLLVVLHDESWRAVPKAVRRKVRVIRQSADPVARAAVRRGAGATFEVALVAHLRAEKDPLRAAIAARSLPSASRLRIVHAGRALSDEFRRAAEEEQAANPRYVWRGEVSPSRARHIIVDSRLLVLTSVTEGGANVLGEAIVSGTPVLASRIPACVAALGADYPGLFPVGNTRALTRLLALAESDADFLATLARAIRVRRPLFTRSAEKSAWRALLAELRVLV